MSDKLKVCLLGATGVGKTSLVRRFVESIFSDIYRTTIGVKIESRRVRRDDRSVDLIVWDLSGEDEFQGVRLAYLRGAAAYLLTVDGTRRETLATALALHEAARSAVGDLPFIVVLNKSDLVTDWDLTDEDARALAARGFTIQRTSARTGEGVEEAFDRVVDAVLAAPRPGPLESSSPSAGSEPP